jgi:hypothetical protein
MSGGAVERVRWGMTVLVLVLAPTLAACESKQPQPVTLLYIDLTRSTATAEASTLHDVGVVVDTVASERGRFLVDVLDDNALAHGRLLIDLSFAIPEAHGNGLVERRKVAERRANAIAAVEAALNAPRPARFTDVFAGVASAGQRLQAFPPSTPRRLVILSDMISNAAGRNLTASTWDGVAIKRLLAGLRTDQLLPRLPGVEVWIGGAGLAQGGRLSATRILQIREVWLAVFAATGATVTFYGPQLLEPPATAALRQDASRLKGVD